MKLLRWFLAGALAVPFFHQVVLAILNGMGWVARQPFSFAATKPFGVPQVVSLAFWGGVWGIVMALVLRRSKRNAFWILAIVFGAIAPTLVAAFVIAPLRGQPLSFNSKMLMIGLAVNAAWGFGTALIAKLLRAR